MNKKLKTNIFKTFSWWDIWLFSSYFQLSLQRQSVESADWKGVDHFGQYALLIGLRNVSLWATVCCWPSLIRLSDFDMSPPSASKNKFFCDIWDGCYTYVEWLTDRGNRYVSWSAWKVCDASNCCVCCNLNRQSEISIAEVSKQCHYYRLSLGSTPYRDIFCRMYVGGDHQPFWILLGGRRDKQHAPVLTTDVVDIWYQFIMATVGSEKYKSKVFGVITLIYVNETRLGSGSKANYIVIKIITTQLQTYKHL